MMHVAASKGKKIDSFVVRKAEKAHGLQRRIEGPDVKGKRVLAVEDTSTTGGSVLIAVEALIEAGAIVVAVAVIVERGAEPYIKEAGYDPDVMVLVTNADQYENVEVIANGQVAEKTAIIEVK
jgi:orotate phosphoribosyltransferase